MTDEIRNVNEALTQLRGLVEKGQDKLDSLDLKQIDKLEATLDSYEEKNASFVAEMKRLENEKADLEERLVSLEKSASRVGASDADEKKAEMAAFQTIIQKGAEDLSPEELKYLRTDNDTAGGYLAPNDYLNEIIKDITEISPIRSIARVRSTSAGKTEIPVRDSLVTAEWEGEAEPGIDSNSTYGLERLPLHKLTVTVPITVEELQDAAFNMEAEINMDIVESFGQKEGAAFVSGTGVKQPKGLIDESRITARASGSSGAITIDNLIDLSGDLKTGYNPVYLMNRRTIADLRKKKTTDGHYLWVAGNIAAGVPNQINGYSYVETPDMQDIATGAIPVAFGDFRQGYMIGESMGLSMIRDPYALKKKGMVEFTFLRRVGGQIIKPEAIKLLKVS